MKLIAVIIAALVLSGCLVKDSNTKSIADEIEEHKQVELAYLNFELEGEGKNAGEELSLNIEVKQKALETCKLNAVKICVVGSKKAQLMDYSTYRLYSPHETTFQPTKKSQEGQFLHFASKPNAKQLADIMQMNALQMASLALV
ncbi:MAG: hypothetical protein OYH77_02435 [Pseudomonadota bacterium]|nr:hypothetical protein [Pseudomonadota bacterium]